MSMFWPRHGAGAKMAKPRDMPLARCAGGRAGRASHEPRKAQRVKTNVKIGLLMGKGHPYARRFCIGVASVALEKGWEMALFPLEDVVRGGVEADAFITRPGDARSMAALKALGKPVVNVYVGGSRYGFSTIDCDHAAIGRLAAEHFLDHRFRNFAFCGYTGTPLSDLRAGAFARRLAEEHFDCDRYIPPSGALREFKAELLRGEWFRPPSDHRRILDWVRRLPKPVAVFCLHDHRAFQLAQICKAAGIDVPREVAILGVDNDEIVCSFSSPMLSSIDPDTPSVGRAAARTLVRLLEEPDAPTCHVAIPPRQVVARTSTEVYPLHPPWLSEALVFISRNVSRNLTATDVVRHLGYSHTSVDRAFRAGLGTSIQKEIVRVRLEMAAHLLRTTTLAVAEVSRRAGFSRPEYFCSSFRAKYGVKPSEYRKS